MPKKPPSKKTQALYAKFLHFEPKKGDLRKMSLIEAAIDFLAQEGIESFTLEAVGKQIQMSKAHVAYYFRNRSELLRAAIRLVIVTGQSFVVEGVESAKSEEDRLEAYIKAHFDWLIRYPKHRQLMLLFYYLSSCDARYRKMHEEIRQLGSERINLMLKRYHPESKPAWRTRTTKEIQALINGHLVDQATARSAVPLEKLCHSTIEEVFDIVDSQ